jgi:hypothetical protein
MAAAAHSRVHPFFGSLCRICRSFGGSQSLLDCESLKAFLVSV